MKEIRELIKVIQYTKDGQQSIPEFQDDEATGAEAASAAADEFIEEPTLTSNTVIDAHLNHIQNLLEQSVKDRELVNIAIIQETMRYIESILIQTPGGLFRSKSIYTLGEKLSREQKEIFPQLAQVKITPTFFASQTIPNENCAIFTGIHDKLREIFGNNLALRKQLALAPLWVYSYPKNESSHVIDPNIITWQRDHAVLLAGDPAYHNDFVRDYSILNMLGKTNQNVDDLLAYLLERSKYNEEEKTLLLTWLKANGGQDNNRFIDLLLASGAYTNGTCANQFKSNGIVQNWTISDTGTIIFQLETVLKGLVLNGEVYQTNPKTEYLEKVELIDDNSHNLLPSMAIKATIELDVQAGIVLPHITDLVVSSFSNTLVRPAQSAPLEEATREIKPK